MANFVISKTFQNKPPIGYVPRISKPGFNERITKCDMLRSEARAEEWLARADVGAVFLLQRNPDPEQSAPGNNSYNMNRGNIYVISSDTEYPPPGYNENKARFNGIKKQPVTEPLDPVFLPGIPRYEQGKTPWCQLVVAVELIGKEIGCPIDLAATLRCLGDSCSDPDPNLGPEDKIKLENDLKDLLDQIIPAMCFVEEEESGRKYSLEEKFACEDRLRKDLSPILANPLLGKDAPGFPNLDDLNDSGKRALLYFLDFRDDEIDRWEKLPLFGNPNPSTMDIVVSCKPIDCPQKVVPVPEEGCEAFCANACKTQITITPKTLKDTLSEDYWDPDAEDFDYDRIFKDFLREGKPIPISVDSGMIDNLIKTQPINIDDYTYGTEPIFELGPGGLKPDGNSDHVIIIIGYERIEPNGPTIIRLQNSWGSENGQIFNVTIPEGTDLGDNFKLSTIWGRVVSYTVEPSPVDQEAICEGCGKTIECEVTPTPSPTTSSPPPTPSSSTPAPTPSSSTPAATPSSTSGGSAPTPSIPT